MKIKKVLTIAGSDSGGGAGIQADLKTFVANGVFGMSVVTAVTAQNTKGVQGITELSGDFVALQIDSVMEDMGADCWKTGMLVNEEIINVVAQKAMQYKIKFLVLDPVIASTSGDLLLKRNSLKALVNKLFPLSYVITPNIIEAQNILGEKIQTKGQMKNAAVLLWKKGPKNVLIKGGHLPQGVDAVDILYDGKKFIEFHATWIKTKNNHGTGCTLSSAIAANLAKGLNIERSIDKAKNYLTSILKSSARLSIGKGHGPLDHGSNLSKP